MRRILVPAALAAAVFGCDRDLLGPRGETFEIPRLAFSNGAMAWVAEGLGTLGGDMSEAWGINDDDWVVGSSETASGATHAFLWTEADGMQDLGTLGGDFAEARAVNASGVVVGTSSLHTGEVRAFRWADDGPMEALPVPEGLDACEAFDINDAGQIAGFCTGADAAHAMVWHGAETRVLDSPLDFPFAGAFGINEPGDVVGIMQAAGSTVVQPFLWTEADGMVALDVPADALGVAHSVNASREVAGHIQIAAGGTPLATVWSDDSAKQLETYDGGSSEAFDINDAGTAVGFAAGVDSVNITFIHATLWPADGAMVDLGTLPDHGASRAHAVNAGGVVAGVSFSPGSQAVIWRFDADPGPGYCAGGDGVEIGFTLTGGPDPVGAGETATWDVELEVVACEDVTDVSAQGGTVGWASTDVSTDDGEIVVRRANPRNRVFLWTIGAMAAGDVATATFEVTGTVGRRATCGSELALTGEWTATATAEQSGAEPTKYDEDGPVTVLVGC